MICTTLMKSCAKANQPLERVIRTSSQNTIIIAIVKKSRYAIKRKNIIITTA